MYVKRKTETNWAFEKGVWFPRKQVMNNLLEKRISTMKTENVVFNLDIDNEFLSLRSLTDAAFRERNMQALNAQSSQTNNAPKLGDASAKEDKNGKFAANN